MPATVKGWRPVEVQTDETLPENFVGLLDWVLDESVVADDEDLSHHVSRCPSQAAENHGLTSRKVSGQDQQESQAKAKNIPPAESPLSNAMAIEGRMKDESTNKDEGQATSPADPDHISVSSVNTAPRILLKVAEKGKISSEEFREQDLASPDKDLASSWSVSAIGEDPTTPPKGAPLTERPCQGGGSPTIEVLHSLSKPRSLSVAAWVLDTTDAPVPNLVLPKATNASTHCCAIDPESGTFLPAIDYPETRKNHQLESQSEPGWCRGNMTSGMQINREMKVRAKLAERAKERLHISAQINEQGTVMEEQETSFPKAYCAIRPATDNDVGGILDILKLERQCNAEDNNKPSTGITKLEVLRYFNLCKKERRPFIIATGPEDDLLDQSKWPPGADRAYQEYVEYRSKSSKPKATIVGFAFAMPRQSPSLEVQGIRVDHSCYVTLMVHPDHRNKKYGSALLDRILTSVSPIHRSLIDFEWKCDDPTDIYEQIASNNTQQYARVIVEFLDAHDESQRKLSGKKLLEKFGFSRAGHLTCLKSETRDGKRHWLDLFIWELEAQSLDNVR
ncbi:Acyl-CoA N-acyltransferase [Cordyceps militaris CM01]|uniref:Acyl-CoA N-acyltransferase n=1 Tax=Cordyceps militaris (strain CM01) TaxID=983644 RepID=G3JBT9_CORMM|nr:Acyl-CoA N-acyltransferase [Cordyceps militaris CM01]EGX94512.1 Acyl-CoA N-acyltransferase [Cordyceps militaris CM01]